MADVLLVDDDGSVLLTLAIALRRQGHNVTVAGDAMQALSHLKRRHFQFLVSDVRMPGLSGVELAARVRRMTRPPEIILTSAYPYVETRNGIARAFLQKPIDIDHLQELLAPQTESTKLDDLQNPPSPNSPAADEDPNRRENDQNEKPAKLLRNWRMATG